MAFCPIVIAVDGTAASGKGTLAKLLARYYRFAHLDTGKLYRMVGLAVLDANGDPDDEIDALNAVEAVHPDPTNPTMMANARLLGRDVGAAASRVAAHERVRAALLRLQRDFAENPPGCAHGACIDGRDIGTIVCRDAAAKLFVDALPEVRANRRWLELQSHHASGNCEVPTKGAILADILARDRRDRTRAVAPLVPAADADLLDTSQLDIDAAFAAALGLVSLKIGEALKARHRG
ncbi:MAG TPA: (d)CMP kinase [Rhizomicrobium sp.]